MSREAFKAGMGFRSAFVEEDVFQFAFPSTIINGEGLYRRFNKVGGFMKTNGIASRPPLSFWNAKKNLILSDNSYWGNTQAWSPNRLDRALFHFPSLFFQIII
jgi:hypothetical protein